MVSEVHVRFVVPDTEMNQVSLEIPYLFCSLGEGPSWDTETQSLCFVDINNEMV
jgi:sugar lactone lactonase YvrE